MNPQEDIRAGQAQAAGLKRILITGKDSYVGVSVKEYLSRWPDRYSVEELDVRFDTWKDADFSGYDAVFHVAGLAHVNIIDQNEQTRAKYFSINADLTVMPDDILRLYITSIKKAGTIQTVAVKERERCMDGLF